MPVEKSLASHDVLSAKGIELSQIRAAIQGQVISPEDEAYEKARMVFYGGFDPSPVMVIKAANAEDVAYAIKLARQTGLTLAIRSGGHSMAGYGTVNGGIVLDLSLMKGLEINVEDKTAWAETGLTAGEYTLETSKHGLATGFGDTGSVGIGGITLGGGVGFLVRKHGLTIDSLLAAEIVTADGSILTVDEQNHPDLFWAIRGGGGNFGVVTRFKFRLQEVSQIVGGTLILPASPEILQGIIDKSEAAPEELSVIAAVMKAPPMPMIPSEYHGKLISYIMLVYLGDAEAGEKAIAPFRALATPLADMVKPMAYHEMYPDEENDYHPTASGRTLFIDSLGMERAETVFDYLKNSSAMMAVCQVRVLGGAAERVPVEATAYAHRKRRIMVNVAAIYQNPADKAQYETWVSQFAAALNDGNAGVYVNFVGDEGAERVRAAYPGQTWERLREIKTKVDPTNLFHHNQNIPPHA